MNIKENVSLANYSTMRLGGLARYLAEVTSEQELIELVDWANDHKIESLIIGGGSNLVWRDEGYSGLVIVNRIMGREVIAEDNKSTTVRVGAGEKWDEVVAWSVSKNLSGIEFLSAIPGSSGAAPVQNIGAYGAEIADCLVGVAVYDRQLKAFGSIAKSHCEFAYRTSRFKTTDRGRFIITSLVLRLKKCSPKPPFYEVLQAYLEQHRAQTYTPEIIRNAVIAIRAAKLPDPSVVANNGSFFTNPIVEPAKFEELEAKYPDIPHWPANQGIKLSAGWLAEQAGFKDYHDAETGMGTTSHSAIVLVNEHAKSTADLLKFKSKIVDKVQQMFGVTLAQEPELLP